LGPVEQSSEHLAGLVAVIVNRLLSEYPHVRLFFLRNVLQQLRDCKWLELLVKPHICGDVHSPIAPHREGGAKGLLRLLRSN